MKRTNKKGFTIVELVIVIAVIAILAAVLIPTFTGLVDKANVSADQQAVRQMNTVLAASDAEDDIKTVADAVLALREANIELSDYKALSKNNFFYFVLDVNGNPRIILANEKNEILYPEAGDIDLPANAQWMALNGSAPTDDSWTESVANKEVTINNGAQFADFINDYSNNDENATDVNNITLNGNVDLKGASVSFGKVNQEVTISAPVEAPATISGLRADSYTQFGASGYPGKSYGYGLFGDITKDVTIENVTFAGLTVGDTDNIENGTVGLIAGYVKSGATLTLRNVTFKDCTVFGYDKVGAIVGQLYGTLKLENVKFENTKVAGSSYAASLAGLAYANSSITVDADCDLRGITVSVYEPSLEAWGETNPTMNDVATVGEDATYIYYVSGSYEYWSCTTSAWCWKSGLVAKAADGKRYVTVNEQEFVLAGSAAPYTGEIVLPAGE